MKDDSKDEEEESNRSDIILGSILFLLVVTFWYLSWQYIDTYIFSNDCELSDAETRGVFGDKFGAINALFSALAFAGIIFTIFLQKRELKLQRKELGYTRAVQRENAEANKQIAQDTKANAIVDLYQTHTTDYFYNLSRAAWNVLMNCLANKDYSDYLVSTFFVSDYKSEEAEETNQIIYQLYAHRVDKGDTKAMLDLEYDERHRLDDFINFYSVLALRDAPIEVFEKCDFFYDWWRPLLWWISDKRFATYEKDDRKVKYSTKPRHLEILERLDTIYGFETLKDTSLRWDHFINHPLVKNNNFDPRHQDPYT